jgi:hypothetical protein
MPISVRLDDAVRLELESVAKLRGIGLAKFLRDLAADAARDARRARIRQASAAVGAHIASSPAAASFYQEWGTPRPDAG